MEQEDKIKPAGLHPRLVKRLLDKLETDNNFRAQFQASPEQALSSLGYTDSASCLTLKSGATLASPEQIKAQREKLEESLYGIQKADCPLEAQEGM